jgi:hypothetical protein
MARASRRCGGAGGGCRGRCASARPTAAPTTCCRRSVAAICDANPGLEVQIVALPRVFNLSKREADMAIAVSPPGGTGRLTVQKITDYRLHLAARAPILPRAPIAAAPTCAGIG